MRWWVALRKELCCAAPSLYISRARGKRNHFNNVSVIEKCVYGDDRNDIGLGKFLTVSMDVLASAMEGAQFEVLWGM